MLGRGVGLVLSPTPVALPGQAGQAERQTAMKSADTPSAAAVWLLGAGVAILAARATGAPLYSPPAGVSYVVEYEGAADAYGTTSYPTGDHALDGNWTHHHTSDAWGPAPPATPWRPGDGNNMGGAITMTDADGTTYLRIVDCSTTPPGTGSYNNRKIGFYYENLPGVLDPGYPLLTFGCSLHVRWRLPAELVDGLQGPDGKEIDNDGRGIITLQQNLPSGWPEQQIGFSLAVKDVDTGAGTPPATVPENGLLMNNLVTSPSREPQVDLGEDGTMNLVPLDVTQWHEMWLEIWGDGTGGGTHRVQLYLDGSLTPQVIHLTAGRKVETDPSLGANAAALAMLHNQSRKTGMIDIDFVKLVQGPWAPVPEPTALGLLALGGLGVLLRRRHM